MNSLQYGDKYQLGRKMLQVGFDQQYNAVLCETELPNRTLFRVNEDGELFCAQMQEGERNLLPTGLTVDDLTRDVGELREEAHKMIASKEFVEGMHSLIDDMDYTALDGLLGGDDLIDVLARHYAWGGPV